MIKPEEKVSTKARMAGKSSKLMESLAAKQTQSAAEIMARPTIAEVEAAKAAPQPANPIPATPVALVEDPPPQPPTSHPEPQNAPETAPDAKEGHSEKPSKGVVSRKKASRSAPTSGLGVPFHSTFYLYQSDLELIRDFKIRALTESRCDLNQSQVIRLGLRALKKLSITETILDDILQDDGRRK